MIASSRAIVTAKVAVAVATGVAYRVATRPCVTTRGGARPVALTAARAPGGPTRCACPLGCKSRRGMARANRARLLRAVSPSVSAAASEAHLPLLHVCLGAQMCCSVWGCAGVRFCPRCAPRSDVDGGVHGRADVGLHLLLLRWRRRRRRQSLGRGASHLDRSCAIGTPWPVCNQHQRRAKGHEDSPPRSLLHRVLPCCCRHRPDSCGCARRDGSLCTVCPCTCPCTYSVPRCARFARAPTLFLVVHRRRLCGCGTLSNQPPAEPPACSNNNDVQDGGWSESGCGHVESGGATPACMGMLVVLRLRMQRAVWNNRVVRRARRHAPGPPSCRRTKSYVVSQKRTT